LDIKKQNIHRQDAEEERENPGSEQTTLLMNGKPFSIFIRASAV